MRTLTYAELKREVDAIAAGLRALGVGKGDPVAVFMPMVAEAVIAAYAIAKLGAIYMPIFSGLRAVRRGVAPPGREGEGRSSPPTAACGAAARR